MKENRRSKLMTFLLTMTLLLSIITFIPTGTLAQEVKWYNEYDNEVTTSFENMTPGDKITVKGSDLIVNERHYVYFESISGDPELLDDQRADTDGKIEIEINVPYRGTLGTYQMYLRNGTWGNGTIYDSISVDITNKYEVKYKSGGSYLDYVLLDKEYYYPNDLEISVWNWTGAKYELYEEPIDITLWDPPGTSNESWDHTSTGYMKTDYQFIYTAGYHYENNYWVEVNENAVIVSYQPLPVKLNMTASIPSDIEWGDTFEITGYLYNGSGDKIVSYDVMLLSPSASGDTYIVADQAKTATSGRYYLSVSSDEGGNSAGTWYLGTYDTGTYRIDETDIVDYTDFIHYFSFEVATSDTAVVKLEDPDKIISGFNQTIQISVYNTSWNDAYFDDMWVHLTGLETEWWDDPTGQKWYDKDEIITLGNYKAMAPYLALSDGYSNNYKYAYYEIPDIKFNETGQAKIIVTWDHSNSYYEDIKDLEANITGSTTFSVEAAADMNIYVENMVDEVQISALDACCKQNDSQMVTIEIYGNDISEKMNASIYITGCGLDIEIDEEDAIEDGYWISEGVYEVSLSPKTGGTITITCINDTEDMSTTEDYAVSGLTGSATTSDGNDKEITVNHEEEITFTVNYGQYAEINVCYFDKYWENPECLLEEEMIGDNTEGNGLNGIYTITYDVDDLDHVGFVVLTADAGGNFMYDIIEVAPVHDLVVYIINPDNTSLQTLTCGLEHSWEFEIHDGDGDIVTDIDYVIAEVLDEDEDTIQEYELKPASGDIWEMDDFVPMYTGDLLITAWNNTDEDEHDGNTTFMIDCATIEYTPGGITAAIGIEDLTVEVIAKDANGMPLPEGTVLYINAENDSEIDCDSSLTIDEDGTAEFDIADVGDIKQDLNVTFQQHWVDSDPDAYITCGTFYVMWPNFEVDPETIYIGQSNTIYVTVTDYLDEPIVGINLTLYGSASLIQGGVVPDPEKTDENGMVTFSLDPIASGKLNLTIVREIIWSDLGLVDWDESDVIVTDTTVTITSLKPLTISVSKSPIYEGETLTVKVLTGPQPVSDISVTFGEETAKTNANGEVTFVVPNPGVESAIYTITAQKNGYITEEKQITVLKVWEISISGPEKVKKGETFKITVIAKGQPLAGATVTYDGKTKTTDGSGAVSLTAPSKEGTYTITASYGNYKSATLTITISGESPGFELITLIIGLAVAFILLRRRRK